MLGSAPRVGPVGQTLQLSDVHLDFQATADVEMSEIKRYESSTNQKCSVLQAHPNSLAVPRPSSVYLELGLGKLLAFSSAQEA